MVVALWLLAFCIGVALIVWGAEAFAEHLGRASVRLGVSSFALALLLAGAEPEELTTAVVASLRGSPGDADPFGQRVVWVVEGPATGSPKPERGEVFSPVTPASGSSRPLVRVNRAAQTAAAGPGHRGARVQGVHDRSVVFDGSSRHCVVLFERHGTEGLDVTAIENTLGTESMALLGAALGPVTEEGGCQLQHR